MKCEICGMGPLHGISVYRTGPTGQKTTQWRCEAHLPTEKRNEDVIETVNLIESEEKPKH